MVIDLTAAEVDLIVWGLTTAYPVLALQLLDPEAANEILALTEKFEGLRGKRVFRDDYWLWVFFMVGLIAVVLLTGLQNAIAIADCSW